MNNTPKPYDDNKSYRWGCFPREFGKGRALPGKLGRSVLILFSTALVFSLLAALLVSRTSMGEARVPLMSAAVLFLSGLCGAYALGVSGQRRRRWFVGLLYGMVLAVIALMIGFLVASDQMSARGLLLVLAACFAGGVCGALLGGREKNTRQKSRFAFAPGKR